MIEHENTYFSEVLKNISSRMAQFSSIRHEITQLLRNSESWIHFTHTSCWLYPHTTTSIVMLIPNLQTWKTSHTWKNASNSIGLVNPLSGKLFHGFTNWRAKVLNSVKHFRCLKTFGFKNNHRINSFGKFLFSSAPKKINKRWSNLHLFSFQNN